MLLVAGGDSDPNVATLLKRLAKRRKAHKALLVGKSGHPVLHWELGRDVLSVDGDELRPDGLFIRHDVFTNMADNNPASAHRAYAWYSTLASWAHAHAGVKLFNRRSSGELMKPLQLVAANELGIAIPDTFVTNDLARLKADLAGRPLVAKPVNGGDYCVRIRDILVDVPARNGRAAGPAIVQEELVPPDIRVFCVGDRTLCYEIESDGLDYRNATRCRVKETRVAPSNLLARLLRLSGSMGLDFSACDLKFSPARRELVFLEINSAPMFVAFDQASKGRLCDAIIDYFF